MPGGAGLGERKRNRVSGIATLLLVLSSQACSGSQEYVDSPDARKAELDRELSLVSDLPIARTPDSRTTLSSTIQESGTVISLAGAVGDRSAWVGRLSSVFESQNPGVVIRPFDPNSDQALAELLRGNLDLLLTTKPLSYSQKRQGLRQESLGLETWVPIVHPRNLLFDISKDELREILAGSTRHWSLSGKQFAEVRRYILDPQDQGQREAWRSLWPAAVPRPHGAATRNWLELLTSVASERGAVALVPLDAAQSPGIKILSVDGKRATYQTLAAGSYPLSYRVYVTYRVDGGPEALRFKDCLLEHQARGRLLPRPGR